MWAVNNAGARYGSVPAAVQEIEWVKNEPGHCVFEYPTLHPKARTIQALTREVQVWRNGSLLWWGIPVRPDANADRVRWRARDLLWLFDHLYVGRPNRTDYLLNGSFESDLANWTTVNTTPTIVTDHVVRGTKAVRLEQLTAQQDAYLQQVVRVTGSGVGTVWTLAGHYYIPPETWEGEAFDARGLTLSRRDLAGNIVESTVFEITGDPQFRALPQRAEITISTPANVTEDLLIRPYSPAQHIYWDALSLTIYESISSVSSGYPNYDWTSDMSTMLEKLVQHAQDTAYLKKNLNIGTDCPASGKRVERHYQHSEHANIGDAMRDYPREGGPDYWIDYTPTTRTFRCRAVRGTHRPEAHRYLVWDAVRGRAVSNMAEEFSWAFEGEQAVSSSTVLGPGDGPDREEGGYNNAALFGDITMEHVRQAPPEASLNSLDPLAAEEVARFGNPELLTISFRQPELIGVLMPGDTLPVLIDYGFVPVDGTYRVVRLRLNCVTEVFTATLNKV